MLTKYTQLVIPTQAEKGRCDRGQRVLKMLRGVGVSGRRGEPRCEQRLVCNHQGH